MKGLLLLLLWVLGLWPIHVNSRRMDDLGHSDPWTHVKEFLDMVLGIWMLPQIESSSFKNYLKMRRKKKSLVY